MDLEDAWKLYRDVNAESLWVDVPIDCLCNIAEATNVDVVNGVNVIETAWETAFLFTQVCKTWKHGIAGADAFWRKRFAVDYGITKITISRNDCSMYELKRVKIRGRSSSFDSGDKILRCRRVKQIHVQDRGGMVLDMFGKVWVWGTSYLLGVCKSSFGWPSRVKIYDQEALEVRVVRIPIYLTLTDEFGPGGMDIQSRVCFQLSFINQTP
jgi:hypothetical protein